MAWLRDRPGNVILLPGAPPARAASTVNRALAAVMSFYDFHRLQGVELAESMLDPLRGGRGAFRPFLAGIAKGVGRGRRGGLPVARRAPRVLSLEQVLADLAVDLSRKHGRRADTGDLLIALTAMPGGIAALALSALGIAPDALLEAVEHARSASEPLQDGALARARGASATKGPGARKSGLR